METISFNSVVNTLSDDEMKLVKGREHYGIVENEQSNLSDGAYCYRCYSDGQNTARVCYKGHDTCVDVFGDKCPAGGFFWECSGT